MDIDPSDAAGALDCIEEVIAAIPAGQNPYVYLEIYISKLFMSRFLHNFPVIMEVALVMFCISITAAVISLVAKYMSGSLWFFKFRQDANSSYRFVLPNTTALFIVFSACFSIVGLSTTGILLHIARNLNETDPSRFLYVFAFLWPGMNFALFSDAWGMAVASILSTPSFRVLGFKITAPVVNTFFISHFFIALAATIPPSIVAAGLLHQDWLTFLTFKNMLKPLLESWNGGAAQIEDSLLVPVYTMWNEQWPFYHTISISWYANFAATLTVALVFIPSSVVYLGLLRKQLKMTRTGRLLSSNEHPTSDSGKRLASKAREIRRAYVFMFVEVLTVLLATICYVAITAWSAAHSKRVFTDPKVRSIFLSIILFLYPLLSLPVLILIAVRSVTGYNSAEGKGSISDGRRTSFATVSSTPSNYAIGMAGISVLGAIDVQTEETTHIEKIELSEERRFQRSALMAKNASTHNIALHPFTMNKSFSGDADADLDMGKQVSFAD